MAVILDPVGQVRGGERQLNPRLNSLDGKTIGVIVNGQPNAPVVLGYVAELLQKDFPSAQIIIRTKPSYRNRAPEEILSEMSARAHVVITGLGA
ncbi:MAG: hypothetical protein HY695_29915 [Deltaproteobacteria bacterium]|nr:hypothetical protein [Deltaproteobacteria bacterium]